MIVEANIKKLEISSKASGWTGFYMWTKFKPNCFSKGSFGGYTLLELVITVTIMATLAAVAIPTYLESQGEAKAKMSQANMINIRQAFVNNFYHSIIDQNKKDFPEKPSDNQMTYDWANTTVLYDGGTVANLFSEGYIIYNPLDNPYLYDLLGSTNPEEATGFKITDPDMGIIMEFKP